MPVTPRDDIRADRPTFENEALIAPTGFREYDARLLYPDEINLLGMQALGLGLGTLSLKQYGQIWESLIWSGRPLQDMSVLLLSIV